MSHGLVTTDQRRLRQVVNNVEDEIIVTYAHAKKLKYCSKGIRRFCQTYGINYLDFVKNGISSKRLEKIADPLALKLVEVAKECHLQNQR